MNLKLVRFAYLPDVTLGRLYVGDQSFATLEEPWRPDPDGPGGQRREQNLHESCVPDGWYTIEPHTGATLKDVYALVNHALGVYHWPGEMSPHQRYGRSAICIHAGRTGTVEDILGCVLVGLAHSMNGSRHAVVDSYAAVQKLRDLLGKQKRRLLIRPIAGTLELS